MRTGVPLAYACCLSQASARNAHQEESGYLLNRSADKQVLVWAHWEHRGSLERAIMRPVVAASILGETLALQLSQDDAGDCSAALILP